jgi:signal transduction histidine kinase
MVYNTARPHEKVPWYHRLFVHASGVILFAAITVLVSNTYFTYKLTVQTLEDEFIRSENTAFVQTIHHMDQAILDNVLHFISLSHTHTLQHFFTEIRDSGSSEKHPTVNVLEDVSNLNRNNILWKNILWKRIDLIDMNNTVYVSTDNDVVGSQIDVSEIIDPSLRNVRIGTTNIYDIAPYEGIGDVFLAISEIHAWTDTASQHGTEVVGYSIGYLSPEHIFNTIESFTENHPDTVKPFVILRNDGTVLFQNTENISSALQASIHTPPTENTDLLPEDNMVRPTYKKYILHSLSQGYETFEGFAWHIMTEVDTSSIRKDLQTTFVTHVQYYIPAVVFAATIVLAYIYYFLVTPLALINKHLEDSIATGSTKPLTIKSKSEIGRLANAYNQFIREIEDRASKLTKTIEEIRSLNSELESTKTATLNVLEDLDEEKKKVDETVKIRTRELLAEQQKLMHITENMFAGVILTDESGKPVFVNKQGKKILHLGDDISNALTRLYEKFPSPQITALVKAYTQGKSSVVKEIENEDGIFEIMGRCNTLQKNTDHEFTGKGIWLRNITEEKQLERSKSELVAVASHQLRTPLTVTRGNLEMLLDDSFGKVNKKQRELLSDSQESIIRLITMVNDMLDITKIEKGDKKLVLEDFDILQPIETVVASFDTYTERFKYTIQVNKPEKAIMVRGDKALIVQIFQNLIDNALRYGREHRMVTISFKIQNAFVAISITDNGIGIPSQEKASIFQRFYRASNAVRSTSGGSGLGLFIVKSFIEQMKGNITVTSTEGVGTTFVVSLPLAK